MTLPIDQAALRRAVWVVALLNLAYFGVEFAVALTIGSVSLFADSVDFLEDTAVNLLIVLALGWPARARARVGRLLAGILLVPALAFGWALWRKLQLPVPPAAVPLSLTGAGALLVNLTCAVWLTRYRHHAGSLTRAAFLSARNDALANLGIIAAGGATALSHSVWPDVVVGLAIGAMNLDAAREVWKAAKSDRRAAETATP